MYLTWKLPVSLSVYNILVDTRGQRINPLNANPTKNGQNICRLLPMPTNCLNELDHFVELTLKGLKLNLDNQPE